MPPPIIVVMPDMSASSICCGQMKWTCKSMAPGVQDLALAGDNFGARANDDVDPGLRIGIACFSDPLDRC